MSSEWSKTANIRPKSTIDRSGRALQASARTQHGVLTLAQLEHLGLSPRAVRHRVASGRLVRLHHGIYGTGRPSQRGRWMAAVLACGPGGVLSHRSSAELWELLPRRAGPIHVTAPLRTGRRRPGLALHTTVLPAGETAMRDGIPCTTVARTLLDLAASCDRRTLERAIDQAEILSVFDLNELRDTAARGSRRRGVAALQAALVSYDGPSITASAAEENLLAAIRSTDLPRPEVNATLTLADGTAYRADCLWRTERLIVEVDGRAYHARHRSFESDRVRDRQLALAGYETRRFAASEVFRRPRSVTAEIATFLRLAQDRMGEHGRHMAGMHHSSH